MTRHHGDVSAKKQMQIWLPTELPRTGKDEQLRDTNEETFHSARSK